jgi:NAD dependent epimerase/dehydratase family enzyme
VSDLVRLYLLALDDDDVRGPLNGTAPAPVSMRDFAAALGRALSRPSWLKVPRLALQVAFGEGANALTTGQYARPAAALARGFEFSYPDVDSALTAAIAARR